jgi:hypothetical protein
LENISKSKTNCNQRISITVKKLQITWINKYRTMCEEITARLGGKGSSVLDDDNDDNTDHDADAATLPLRQCATSLLLRESETGIVK